MILVLDDDVVHCVTNTQHKDLFRIMSLVEREDVEL